MTQGAGPAASTMGACDPFNFPTVFDHITTAGVDSPGHCEVGEFTRKYKMDHKEGKGTKGATTTLTGLPPAKGKVTFWVWMASQFAEWDAYIAILKQYPEKGLNSMDTYYPTLADIDVTQLTTGEISSWVPDGARGQGYWKRWVEFVEYSPSPAENVTSTSTSAQQNAPGGSSGGGSGSGGGGAVNPPDPHAAEQAEIESLMKQAQQP